MGARAKSAENCKAEPDRKKLCRYLDAGSQQHLRYPRGILVHVTVTENVSHIIKRGMPQAYIIGQVYENNARDVDTRMQSCIDNHMAICAIV